MTADRNNPRMRWERACPNCWVPTVRWVCEECPACGFNELGAAQAYMNLHAKGPNECGCPECPEVAAT